MERETLSYNHDYSSPAWGTPRSFCILLGSGSGRVVVVETRVSIFLGVLNHTRTALSRDALAILISQQGRAMGLGAPVYPRGPFLHPIVAGGVSQQLRGDFQIRGSTRNCKGGSQVIHDITFNWYPRQKSHLSRLARQQKPR